MLTAIAVLFSMMLALPRQAQAQNTVTIDGVTKNILSTEFAYGDGDANAFAATLYLSSDKKEYVLVTGNQKLHATYKYILPTSYEPRHDEQWYWGVEYTKNGYGNELFRSWADPTESWSLFSSGEMCITGYPKPPREVCGIILESGKITDSKHGDGNEHTISIDYKYERTQPTPGTFTVGTVTDSAISLSWTHGNDNKTPQSSLFYTVWFMKDGGNWIEREVGKATSCFITRLEPNTKYWVDVRVLDESGNYIDYGQKAVTTKPVTYPLSICGKSVTSANCGNLSVIPGVSGTVMYNPTTRTLTLQNAKITNPSHSGGIASFIENLEIKVTGTCNVAAAGNYSALRLAKPSTITSTGTLNATSKNGCGINSDSKLTIDGCTVKAVGKQGIAGYFYSMGELTIRNANVTAEGTAGGSICDFKTLTLDGCTITQPAGAAFSTSLYGVALGGTLVKGKVVISNGDPRYDVVLESCNTSKINCIKEVKALTGLGLKESKDLVEAAPSLVLGNLSLSEALSARDRLIAAGGTANIYLHGTWTSTGIASPTIDVPARHRGIYTLQGVKLQGDFDSLPAGIYIVDGRKVVKK